MRGLPNQKGEKQRGQNRSKKIRGSNHTIMILGGLKVHMKLFIITKIVLVYCLRI